MALQVTTYQSGFGNYFESEALEGALPIGRNSPQKPSLGLYAEQLNGSAFTCPRQNNLRSWLYRIQPSVIQGEFQPSQQQLFQATSEKESHATPVQMRWDPLPFPDKPCDFIQGLVPWVTNGSAGSLSGNAVYLYCANQSMDKTFFYSADGELLIVPQSGNLKFKTEFGPLDVIPGEIIVIPRGVKFQVINEQHDKACGYVCENFGAPLQLPDLGPIGANGLANPRDFKYPTAAYNTQHGRFQLIAKFHGHLWQAPLSHNPLDVVAWHGNYAPYKYNLRCFNTINTVSFDHLDPSISTVLTSQTDTAGIANLDFVIFPPRWVVAENTFRPPYYHRNIMSEFMGLIDGSYDAKPSGFLPGGCSLHNCMSAHGPDVQAFKKATHAALQPEQQKGLAFMFESKLAWKVTDYALNTSSRQKDYLNCWKNLPIYFNTKASEETNTEIERAAT
jgi:homogentisate 1,2-dioxygenase